MTGRPKHLWSIYEKMVVRGKEFDELHDLVGIRVIVESEKDCWAALGSIHAIWPPVQGRFKDYINIAQVQPLPVAAHDGHRAWTGKPDRGAGPHPRDAPPCRVRHRRPLGLQGAARPAEDLAWLQRIVDWQQETTDPIEFLETLKLDLEQDEVYVFTPKGKVIALGSRATPVDFAYAIHTEVGHRCIGATRERPARPARHHAQLGATPSRSSPPRSPTAGPSPRLAAVRRLAAGPQQDPPVVLPGAPRGRHRAPAATS